MNTFGANLLNVMNTRETVSNQKIKKNTLLQFVEAGCFGINCGGEGILTADSHILL
jgi:hypothetical protein